MSSDGSVTRYIRDLKDSGRDAAARALWERFFADLVRHAQSKLRILHADCGAADEEDAALRAFAKVCRGIEEGRLRLEGRLDLVRLLRKATEREALNQQRRRRPAHEPNGTSLDRALARGMTPEFVALAREGCRQLLDRLDDPILRSIALGKLVGYTNKAIAERLSCSVAKVERKLGRIRDKWADLAPDGPVRPGPRGNTAQDGTDTEERTTLILRKLTGQE
jgi:DNA-directed RNA polymerase specialized sigma24 family protein